MKHWHRFLFIILLTIVLIPAIILSGCAGRHSQASKPVVFVSILPQQYFVNKIAGGLVDVVVMVEPGASPHTYEPKPFQMAQLSQAAAYFSIGVEFEKVWLARFAALSPRMLIIHSDTLIAKMSGHDFTKTLGQSRINDTYSPDSHEAVDPHIWLSPELVKQQAHTICTALQRIDPLHAQLYSANCASFLKEIEQVQDTIHSFLKPGCTFMVFHPSWAYFSREFGLKQIAIEIDGKEPSPRELAFIFEEARIYHLSAIFVQPQFSQQSAHVIARQLNGRVVIADDLAYNWADNLISVAKAIALQ